MPLAEIIDKAVEKTDKCPIKGELVRCKDCYWRGEDEYCDHHGFYVCGDEFFCASGRADDEPRESKA